MPSRFDVQLNFPGFASFWLTKAQKFHLMSSADHSIIFMSNRIRRYGELERVIVSHALPNLNVPGTINSNRCLVDEVNLLFLLI